MQCREEIARERETEIAEGMEKEGQRNVQENER